MQNIVADKYIRAMHKTRLKPTRGKWIGLVNEVCPLYNYYFMKLSKIDESVKWNDRDRIVEYMTNQCGLEYRNGFTHALDNGTWEPEDNPHYLKGYEHGEYVRNKLFGD